MKYLAMILLIVSLSAQAETKWHLDLDRSGQGIILNTYDDPDDPRIVFAFFGHAKLNTNSPPIVSPPPPSPLFCDEGTIFLTAISLDGMVDGEATGTLLYQVQVASYPQPRDSLVSDTYVVGDFVIKREDGGYGGGPGWTLDMYTNYVLCDLTLFSETFHFTKRIAE
jgi:hypothetical protein